MGGGTFIQFVRQFLLTAVRMCYTVTHTAAGSCLFLSTASCERPSSKHPSDHCTREGGYLRKGGRVGRAYKHSWLGDPSSKQLYVCYCHTLPNSPYLQL